MMRLTVSVPVLIMIVAITLAVTPAPADPVCTPGVPCRFPPKQRQPLPPRHKSPRVPEPPPSTDVR